MKNTEEKSLYLDILGTTILFHSNHNSCLEAIENKFGPYLVPPTNLSTIKINVQYLDNGLYSVTVNQQQAVLALEERWPRIDDLVQLAIEKERTDLFFVHSSCVCYKGHAALFIGASTSGKTTLALALKQAGCIVLAEDTTPLDPKRQVAIPFRTNMSLRENTKQIATERNWNYSTDLIEVNEFCNGVPLKQVFILKSPPDTFTHEVTITENLQEWDKMRELCYGNTIKQNTLRSERLVLRDKQSFQQPPVIRPYPKLAAIKTLLKHTHANADPFNKRFPDAIELLKTIRLFELQCGYLDETVMAIMQLLSN